MCQMQRWPNGAMTRGVKGGKAEGAQVGLGTDWVKREKTREGVGRKEGAQVLKSYWDAGKRRRGAGTCVGRKGVRAALVEQRN